MLSQLPKIILAILIPVAIISLGFMILKPSKESTPIVSKPMLEDKPAEARATRIAIISDIDRCPTRKFATKDSLARFVNFANTQQVDLAVSLGDNIAHRLEDCSTTASTDLDYVMESFASLTMPVHYVLGDHDISSEPESFRMWKEKTKMDETYYSFDQDDILVIILDTVTGGNSLQGCKDDARCSALLTEKDALESELAVNGFSYGEGKLIELPNEPTASEDLNADSEPLSKRRGHEMVSRILSIQNIQTLHDQKAEYLRDDIVRDHGLIGKEQLFWLSNLLETTQQQKILLLADHPLLSYTTNKKAYQINDLETFSQILTNTKERDPKKDIVAIFGETHTWHKSVENDITYFGIDEFRAKDGTWALFTWDDTFRLQKVQDDIITEDVK